MDEREARGRFEITSLKTELNNAMEAIILGLHVTSESFPYLGIHYVGVPPRVIFLCIYMHIGHRYVLTMDSSQNECVPSIEGFAVKSQYCRSIEQISTTE